MPVQPLRPSREGIVAAALCAVFAGATILWRLLDRAPPNWDDAWYLTNSLTVYDSLTHDGIAGYIAKLNSVFGFKAPLIAALPAPFYLLFGRRWHAAFLVNAACMTLLGWVLYRLASRWWSRRAALFAVTIAGTMPLLYGLSHWYMVEYPLAALLAVAIWLLIESESLDRRVPSLLFGVACGLGMLLKVSFAGFMLPAFLYSWAGSRHRLRSLALAALPCLMLAAPWYSAHLGPVLRNALDAGFGQAATVQGTGPIFALRTITTYLARVCVSGISVYYAVLAAALILWTGLRASGRAWLHDLPGKSVAILLFWLLPFAVFLFGGNKDIRYIAPILPAFALLLACLLDAALPRTLLGASLTFLLLGFPVAQLFAVSFGVPYRANGLTYARRFTRETWPHDEMLRAIAANTTLKPGEKETLLVGVDRAAINADNIELSVTALQLPFVVETTAHEDDFDTLRLRLAQASYFLDKDGGEPESPVFNPYSARLAQLVMNDASYTRILDRPLPDGGIARIFKNATPHSRSVDGLYTGSITQIPEEFAIDFGGVLALTGVSTVKAPHSITVRFRWRCLKPPERDYWCFTHLINPEGKIVAQRDHRLLGGNPPLLSWSVGDGGTEELRIVLPADVGPEGLRLRFGLYDPPSGNRLRVGRIDEPSASRFTPADQSTALIARF